MKKIILIFIAILSFISNIGKAQNLIAVQNGGNPAFYTNLDTAITYAQNGDTVYIPGGVFNLGTSYHINKQIHIIGVGHYNDSCQATGITYISLNDLYLEDGSDESSIEGIYL